MPELSSPKTRFAFMEKRQGRPERSAGCLADSARIDEARRPTGFLFDGDHHPGFHSGVFANRSGRKAVSSAGIHQNVRDGRRDDHRGHARARAVHLSARRQVSLGAGKPGDAFSAGIYRPVLSLCSAVIALITVSIAVCSFRGAVFLATGIGSEFMPPLNEGDLMYMPVTDPAISIDEALKIMSKQDEILKSFPEVEWAVGKAGRAETSTDPAPVNMNETIVHLKPPEQWRAGMTRDHLMAEMDEKLRMPGVTNIWTQPIINRIDMLSTGIRSQVGIKIFGNDLEDAGRSVARSRRSGTQGSRRGGCLSGTDQRRALHRHSYQPSGRSAIRHRRRARSRM